MRFPSWLKPSKSNLTYTVLFMIFNFGLLLLSIKIYHLSMFTALLLYLPTIKLAEILGGSMIVLGITSLLYSYLVGCLIDLGFSSLNEKNKKWALGIVLGAVLVFAAFILYPSGPSAPGDAKNCGSEEIIYSNDFDTERECFAEAARNCEPAKMETINYMLDGDTIKRKYWIDDQCRFHRYEDRRNAYGTVNESYEICEEFNYSVERTPRDDQTIHNIWFSFNNCTREY